eukprot:TRINITY_DN9583_c0_g1_i11.p1 TRINITY_DN9583_c0_g1~~TRINITY_DN9583_c0_g1_i11.p1  ORF type:complete len:349 (-),score=76.07 TRINITY_DN9583_c0_g1_i11:837-1883(-)
MGACFCKKNMRYFPLHSSLSVESHNWLKDSYGLYDYSTTQVAIKSFLITSPAKLIRTSQEIMLVDKNQQISNSSKMVRGLLNIGIIRNHYWVYGLADQCAKEEDLWVVLRDHTEDNGCPGHKLREGVIIKMGRCKYVVKRLVTTDEGDKSTTKGDYGDNNVSVSCIEEASRVKSEEAGEGQNGSKKTNGKVCRICLTDENTEDNALIRSPCKCTGSVCFIHVKCLKYWLKYKISERRIDFSVTYMWKDFECEICKTKYPGKLSEGLVEKITTPDGEMLDVVKIDKPKSNYMILELDTATSAGLKTIHVIFLNKKSTLTIVSYFQTDRDGDMIRMCEFRIYRFRGTTQR